MSNKNKNILAIILIALAFAGCISIVVLSPNIIIQILFSVLSLICITVVALILPNF